MATYAPDSRGRCPHCLTVVRFEQALLDHSRQLNIHIGGVAIRSNKESIRFTGANCPECGKLILTVETGKWKPEMFVAEDEFVVCPLQSTRPPVPKEVPAHIAADYNEAALVLNLSPKASAALSRRCLQSVLREAGNADQHDLSKQIDAIIPKLPSYIAENLDAIRNIGNFAAHPLKDQNSGQIIDVEAGEAGWNLDVLDQLFDFYYVQPALAKQKRDALDEKLRTAGKPPMK